MWGWGRPKRDIPQVNYGESSESEEDYEEGLNFNSPLVSPRRPLPTRQGSPSEEVAGGPTLYDNVDDDLELVQYKLHDIAQVEEEIDELTDCLEETNTKVTEVDKREPEVGQVFEESGLVAGEKQGEDCYLPPVVPEDQEVVMADYDAENENDGDKAQDYARSIKIEFEPNDIVFWFSQLEGEMLMATVKSQWLKKTILQRNLPNRQKEDVKSYLELAKTAAGDDIYLKVKQELIRIYAPKPCDSYKKALTRQMIGLPSQLGYQLINDICKKPSKLDGCCCAAATQALWSIQLPVNIRAHISNMEFTKDTYKQVLEAADQVFLSAKQVSVAAIARPVGSQNLDETLPAFTQQNQPQVVAAVGSQRGGGANRGQRGGRGGRNRGGQSGQQGGQGQQSNKGKNRGPRHSSNPPDSCCDRHFRHGDQSWYCLAPLTCPWASKVISRP